jgi:hypothetical protein
MGGRAESSAGPPGMRWVATFECCGERRKLSHRGAAEDEVPLKLKYLQMIPMSNFVRGCLRFALLLPLAAGVYAVTRSTHASVPQVQETEGEIVANLAGGRVIVHVAKDDLVLFATIDHPIETGAPPPRILSLDTTHIGILLGASEWKEPAAPQAIRLDRDYQAVGRRDPHYSDPSGAEPDLETIGVTFLERLRPLTSQLHHKIEIKKDDPLFEIVIIGFGANKYGPEVWTVEYRIDQSEVGTREGYLQTRILRPRFEQLYPPEKKQPRFVVEARYPDNIEAPTVMELIQSGDPRVAKLRSSDPKIDKAVELISKGQAQKADEAASTDFLRALLPLISDKATFTLGKMQEQGGFDWIVAPEEPVEKTKNGGEDNRPADAPSLRKRPTPQR